MSNLKLYHISRFFLKPLIIPLDYLQTKFTKYFSLMNIGTTSTSTYNKMIKALFNKKDFVLDCGCGIGHFAKLFDTNKYIGLDINSNFIIQAKTQNPKHYFFSFEDKKILIYKKKVSTILINNVIHHLSKDDMTRLFNYFKKNLVKKKIKVFVIEPIAPKNFFSFEFFIKAMDIGDYMNSYSGYLKVLGKFVIIKKHEKIKFEANTVFKGSSIIIEGYLR